MKLIRSYLQSATALFHSRVIPSELGEKTLWHRKMSKNSDKTLPEKLSPQETNEVADMTKGKFPLTLVAGSANPELAETLSDYLHIPVLGTEIKKYADGETSVRILQNVRGSDVFLVQGTNPPVNDNVMQLFLLVDALRRASVGRITAVIPYYGYARQDRKTQARVPISAALVANLIERCEVDRIVAVDLHCGQIQGFFNIPVENLYSSKVMAQYFQSLDLENVVVVSPDAGGVERADVFRNMLRKGNGGISASMAMMNKKRVQANEVAGMELVGSVTDCDAIIVDDIVDTAGTLCKAAEVLKENGARRVYACVTHALLSGPAIERIKNSVIEQLVVSDTVPIPEEKKLNNLHVISVAGLLGDAIIRIHAETSVSDLFC